MSDVRIQEDWKKLLDNEFEKEYFIQLKEFIRAEYRTKTVFPPAKNIFRAFDLVPPEEIKVVILGQDPYHGVGQAHGLCFSVPENIIPPPSLKNIFREIESDMGTMQNSSGNLERWAKQGVFLLNAALTVEMGKANSHQKAGWHTFTDRVIEIISQNCDNVVFMLWGNFARQKRGLINAHKHLILEAAHPSPLSAHNGFFGCRHFSKANEWLAQNGKIPVNW